MRLRDPHNFGYEYMKAAYITLGCKLNYAETSTYERGLVRAGFQTVQWSDQADLYIINTCSVTEHSDKKSRNIIRRIHKLSPDAAIVVTGCYAELKRSEVESIGGVSLVIGSGDKSTLVETVIRHMDSRRHGCGAAASDTEPAISGSAISEAAEPEAEVSGPAAAEPAAATEQDKAKGSETAFAAYSGGEDRTRSFLKVQDGCDNFCAYCTVPFARGRSRSISVAEAVDAAEKIAASGVKEIVLTGVNTGDFGRKSGESFLDLLKALNDVGGIERYRISSIEPNLLTDGIVDWIASGTKFLPHFHIPLQSGSDTILKDVGRRYTTEFFADKIDYIRRKMNPSGGETNADGTLKPSVFFGIDVIAGLPGETEELFMETFNFLKYRIRPAFIHVFPYSARPGTRSAARADQVKDSIKTERVQRLEALCKELNDSFVASQKGVRETVLFEDSCKDGRIGGYTGNYIRVERDWDPSLAGKLVEVVL